MDYKLHKRLFVIGRRSNLSHRLSQQIENVELIAADDLHLLPELLEQHDGANLIYNLHYKSAWLGRRDMPEAYASYSFQRLAEFVAICRNSHRQIGKIIFTSSSAVYGDNALAEESCRCDITNLYASLKFASEMFIHEHLADTGIPLVIARVFNMYGGRDEFSVISKIADAISREVEFHVANHGRPVRDFVHVLDVAEIYRRLLESTFTGVVNVGSGNGLSVGDVIKKAETAFQRRLKTVHIQRNEINHSVASIDKLAEAIGPFDFISVDQFYQKLAVA